MRLKITIIGPKVHDVGYRYFLMSMAMDNGIRRFQARNTKSCEGEAVQAFIDGDNEAVEGFRSQAESKRPDRSQVSKVLAEDYEGEVMKIAEYAQFYITVLLNKPIESSRR